MVKTWVIADPHFGHWGVCKFLREDGSKLRPWENPDDMDNALVDNWNAVVSQRDRVYVLGDVCINRRALITLGRLSGRKVLVKGNHDIFKLKDYLPYFDDIRAYVVLKTPSGNKCILSHIPIHPNSLGRFGTNIHGHLHADVVRDADSSVDPRYICVSVEHINYTPVELSSVLKSR